MPDVQSISPVTCSNPILLYGSLFLFACKSESKHRDRTGDFGLSDLTSSTCCGEIKHLAALIVRLNHFRAKENGQRQHVSDDASLL